MSEADNPGAPSRENRGVVRSWIDRGARLLRRKPERAPRQEGVPVREFIYPEAAEFAEQQAYAVDKHRDEEKPQESESGHYAFGIVSRAYKELSNGNLTERLKSLVTLQIPKSQIKAYLAVNNPRIFAFTSEILAQNKQHLATLDEAAQEKFIKNQLALRYHHAGWRMSNDERSFLTPHTTLESLREQAKGYEENQATLGILREITSTVNKLTAPNANKDALIEAALLRIAALGQDYLTDEQRSALVHVAKLAMVKQVAVMGVDCSSFEKGYDEREFFGKATNEAAHLAFSQGAQFIDVSDMDAYHSPDALAELYQLARNERIDVFRRRLLTTMSQHPEQMAASKHVWADLMKYYANGLVYATPNYGRHNARTSGVVVVSADAFRKHPYPEESGHNGDYTWFDELRADKQLQMRFGLHTHLLHNLRERPGSFDGTRLFEDGFDYQPRSVQPRGLRAEIGEEVEGQYIRTYIKEDTNLLEDLDSLPDDPELKEEYLRMKQRLFLSNQKRREEARRVFLGIQNNGERSDDGAIAKLYTAYRTQPHTLPEQLIRQAGLNHHLGAFFDQNPLIIPGALQEIQRLATENGAIPPLEDVIAYIEQTIPELFAPPLTAEPDPQSFHRSPQSNITDWIHLHQAGDLFARHLGNLENSGQLATYSQRTQVIAGFYSATS